MNCLIEEDLWIWERCRDRLQSLRGRLGFEDAPVLRFLKLALSLEDGRVVDELRGRELAGNVVKCIYCLLCGYADSEPVPETARLISFRQLPGGREYFKAFAQRVLRPLERAFGDEPEKLVEAGELLGGERASYGDASVVIRALPLIPVTVVIWAGDSEFPAYAAMFYDSSISSYLSTEEVTILSELTSARLRHALEVVKGSDVRK